MQQILLTFRIFDTLVKKYLTPDSKVYIGLDGKLVTPEGPDTADRYDLAYSIPLFDVNGQQLFTDDGFITIVGRETVFGSPTFNVDSNCWGFTTDNDNFVPLVSKTFQIFPNADEIRGGNSGMEIQTAWDKKAAELPEPDPKANAGGGYMRTREFQFGCLAVLLTLHSQIDMPEDVWNEHFKAVLESDEIFVNKPAEDKATEEQPAQSEEAVVVKEFKAIVLKSQGSSRAPMDWWKLPEIVAAKPKQSNVEKSLQLVDGTTNIVAWEVGRGGSWAQASDFFMVEEVKTSSDESSNS